MLAVEQEYPGRADHDVVVVAAACVDVVHDRPPAAVQSPQCVPFCAPLQPRVAICPRTPAASLATPKRPRLRLRLRTPRRRPTPGCPTTNRPATPSSVNGPKNAARIH